MGGLGSEIRWQRLDDMAIAAEMHLATQAAMAVWGYKFKEKGGRQARQQNNFLYSATTIPEESGLKIDACG